MSTPTQRPLRILFLLHATNFDRVFENFLRALLERGHAVHVAVDLEKRREKQGSGLVFDQLAEMHTSFSFGPSPPRAPGWLQVATKLRYAIDYLRYLEPPFEHATALRARARKRAPVAFRFAVDRTRLGRPHHRARIARVLRAVEAALPVDESLRSFIAEQAPDVVIVSPLVGLGSSQGDAVRAARRLGIPVVLAVASWDNLTNKGVIRDVPDLTIVWNAAQVEEAVTLHDLPRDSVVATGAHAFDHWFSWRPSTTADEFAAKVGLPASAPLILYVGSSSFIARDEVGFVWDWVRRLRASDHPELRSAGILVRPHPQHAVQWEHAPLDDPGVVVWPRGGVAPIAQQAKADYYDSLFHCRAVVGINTSAQVEAAILRRPVLTLLEDRFRGTQEGTLHFSHLTGTEDAGVLTVARSWDEHLDQLARVIREPGGEDVRLRGFVRDFIRPYGPDVPAAPRAAAAVEGVADGAKPEPSEPAGSTRVLDAATPGVDLAVRVLGTLGRKGPVARAARRGVRLLYRAYRQARMRFGALLGRGPGPAGVHPAIPEAEAGASGPLPERSDSVPAGRR